MTFTRSDAGLSNKALFHDVDFIVYVEGKDIGDKKATPPDAVFWQTLLERFQNKWSFIIQGLGSKTALEPVAKKIVAGTISKTVVCFDADFDRQYSSQFRHQNVLYTYGYSWENDVTSPSALAYVVTMTSTVDQDSRELEELISGAFKTLDRHGRRFGPLDIACQNGGYPIQNKDKPGELLQLVRNRMPTFCASRLMAKIARVRTSVRVSGTNSSGYQFFRDYHGKTIALCGYHIACSASHHFGSFGTIAFDIYKYAILRFFLWNLEKYPDLQVDYYKSIISRVS